MYSKAMYNVALRIVKRAEDAEDVLQESFIKAFKNLKSYKYEATFGAWLKRIVINTAISHLKKKRIHFEEVEKVHVADSFEDTSEPRWDVQKVKKAVGMLPDGYRVIFTMYTLEGYDHQEIGEILNITSSTSKSQYSRAKSKLRELLSEGGIRAQTL
jgi:RNA polymerase sigma-70 factor (ECF subfamily)